MKNICKKKIVFLEDLPFKSIVQRYVYGSVPEFQAIYNVVPCYDLENKYIGDARYDMKEQKLSDRTIITFTITYDILYNSKRIYIYVAGEKRYDDTKSPPLIVGESRVVQNMTIDKQNILNGTIVSKIDKKIEKLVNTVVYDVIIN